MAGTTFGKWTVVRKYRPLDALRRSAVPYRGCSPLGPGPPWPAPARPGPSRVGPALAGQSNWFPRGCKAELSLSSPK